MAKISTTAFVDEMLFIKIAEEDARDAITKQQLGVAMKNMVLGAGAFGLGAGAAGVTLRYALPLLASLSPKQQMALAAGSGLLTAASALAFKKAMERNRELIANAAVSHQ